MLESDDLKELRDHWYTKEELVGMLTAVNNADKGRTTSHDQSNVEQYNLTRVKLSQEEDAIQMKNRRKQKELIGNRKQK